jgi:hypothetical protein
MEGLSSSFELLTDTNVVAAKQMEYAMMILKRLVMSAIVAVGVGCITADTSFAKAKSCKALNIIDPDNDGEMTLAEAQTRAGVVFDKLNKDSKKDSTLDAKELRGRMTAKELKAANPDNDKTIDKAEYLAAVAVRFKAANPDKDATLECKELSTKAGQALYRLLK